MKFKGKFLNAALAAAFALMGTAVFSGQAFAATTGTTTATESISAGTMGITSTATASLSAVTLNGSAQTATGNPGSLTLSDNTGAGNGWHVSVGATQMTEKAPTGGFATGTTASTLPTGSLKLSNSGASISPSGTTSPSPTWSGSSFTIDSGSAVNVLSAAANAGMGNYNVTLGATSLSLSLAPATTFTDPTNYPSAATPYQSTLTYTIVSGP